MQEDFDGGVTSLLPDQNLSTKVSGLLVSFTVFRAQVMDQVNPGADEFAAAGALHCDLK